MTEPMPHAVPHGDPVPFTKNAFFKELLALMVVFLAGYAGLLVA